MNRSPSVKKYVDVGGGLGGPLVQDKVWFFAATRRLDRSGDERRIGRVVQHHQDLAVGQQSPVRRRPGLHVIRNRRTTDSQSPQQIRQHRGTRVMFKADADNIIKYFLPNG